LAGVDPIPKDLLQMIRRVFGNLWENRELTMEDGGLDENAVRWLKTKYGYDELA
jgi:hypothetical protein